MAIEKKENNNEITINLKESSLAEFVKRPVPSEKELEAFDKAVAEKTQEEFAPLDQELDEEIEESLHEIYQDDKGKMVDVKKMDIKKKHGFFYWLSMTVFILGGLGYGGYYGYTNYYVHRGADENAMQFSAEGKSEVAVGEEYFYTISYKNNGSLALKNINVEINYPQNFKVLETYPENTAESKKDWHFETLGPRADGQIRIKGALVGELDDTGVLQASIRYSPENFSSEFKKDAVITTAIKELGIDFDFDFLKNAMVGEICEINLHFDPKETGFIRDFRLMLSPKESMEILPLAKSQSASTSAQITEDRPGVYLVEKPGTEESLIPIRIKFNSKAQQSEKLDFTFDYRLGSSTDYAVFKRETLDMEVMKSDLNLALIVNGSRDGGGVNFGDTLNYSIAYKNKGEADMKDVVIMAVLKSDWLDWSTLKFAESKGREKGNTITWTKEEMPALENIARNQEGLIDFSIDLQKAAAAATGKEEYKAESYARFSVGAIGDSDAKPAEGSNNVSNTVVNSINSDLVASESVRYFNDDNIPVGTGPHPPRVGETTSYKVYWRLSNNLHELNDLAVVMKLPDYVSWTDKNRATVGEISYDESSREVRWQIGRLPVTVFEASGEFSISVTPSEEDRNKIMVLTPGSAVSAIDSQTKAELKKSTAPKTTKLEDDGIGRGDGIVE